jgi:hypothetical protein
MKSNSTNPAYAALAYRRAVLGEVVSLLSREYTEQNGVPAKGVIYAEEISRSDSEVPQEEIGRFMEELQQEEESLRLELAKFDFVRRDEQKPKQVRKPQAKKSTRKAPRRKQP